MTSKFKSLAAVAALAASLLGAGPALAQEATPDTWLKQASSLSRADVAAELAAARANGQIRVFSAGYIEPVRNPALRAEVRAATLQAIASGQLKAINAEAPAADFTSPGQLRLAAR